jgi:hypothetical protein
MELFIIHFSAPCCDHIPFMSKYFLKHPVYQSNQPQILVVSGKRSVRIVCNTSLLLKSQCFLKNNIRFGNCVNLYNKAET